MSLKKFFKSESTFFHFKLFSAFAIIAITIGACGKSDNGGDGVNTNSISNGIGVNQGVSGYLNNQYQCQNIGNGICRTEIPLTGNPWGGGNYFFSGPYFPRMSASGQGGVASFSGGSYANQLGVQVKAGDKLLIQMSGGSGQTNCNSGEWWIFNWNTCSQSISSCQTTPLNTSELYQGQRKGLIVSINGSTVLEPNLNGMTTIPVDGVLKFGINTPAPASANEFSCTAFSVQKFSVLHCQDSNGITVSCPN